MPTGMLDCLHCQDPDFRFADGLTMHDRDHDVSTEIFASMCHPRFPEFDPTDVNDELSDAVIKHQIQ